MLTPTSASYDILMRYYNVLYYHFLRTLPYIPPPIFTYTSRLHAASLQHACFWTLGSTISHVAAPCVLLTMVAGKHAGWRTSCFPSWPFGCMAGRLAVYPADQRVGWLVDRLAVCIGWLRPDPPQATAASRPCSPLATPTPSRAITGEAAPRLVVDVRDARCATQGVREAFSQAACAYACIALHGVKTTWYLTLGFGYRAPF